MATNFPNGVTSQGVPVIPSIPLTTGTYLFVSSTSGSDGNSGRDKQHPLATVQAAIGKCTAGKGDVILLMPGHAETVTATSIALNVSGVQVYGLGTGLLRPTFTYGAAAATITVSAANCSWVNCHFIANFLSVAAAFTLGAAKDFRLDSNTFVDNANNLDFLSIVVTGATANAADGLTVVNNYVYSLPATANAVISVLGNLDRLLVTDNYCDKAATNDAGQFITVAALVCKGARIFRNQLNVVGATGTTVGIFMTGSSTTNTGMIAYNLVTSLDTTTAIFITATLNFAVHENYVSGVVAASGTLYPAADNPA
jgi:hypothetical protein